MAVKRSFAVLLCHFSDGSTDYDVDYYRRLFTAAGAGSGNVVDYFHDASNAHVDVSESQVFAGIALDQSSADYKGSGENQQARIDLINWARAKARASGVALEDYFGVVVLTQPKADVFGGYGFVALNPDTICLGVAAHEMGHALGLAHSWNETSLNMDYGDRFDMMSWQNTANGSHVDYGTTGPLFSAANMRRAGWLDAGRVVDVGSGEHEIALRPLSGEDMPGPLALGIHEFLFEYRPAVGWDDALPDSGGVLVHSLNGDRSVLHFGTLGQSMLGVGDSFARGLPWLAYDRRISVTVLSLTPEEAKLGVQLRAAERAPHAGPGIVFGGVDVGGGGWVIVGGRVIPVPPRQPIITMLERLSLLSTADDIANEELRRAVRMEALEQIEAAVHRERDSS